jgi:hypothetical protein
MGQSNIGRITFADHADVEGMKQVVDSFDDIMADCYSFMSQNAVEEAPRPSDSKMSLLQKLLSE